MPKPISPEVQERRKSILSKVNEYGNKRANYISVANDLGLKVKDVYNDLYRMKEEDPNILFSDGVVTILEPEVKRPERYPDHKNNEGYNDPTAAAAIKSILKTEDKKKVIPKVGEVWHAHKPSNRNDDLYVIVLAVDISKNFAIVINSEQKTRAEFCSIKLYTLPLNLFEEKKNGMPLSYISIVKERIGKMLEIEPDTKVVEKVVEKKVEVPVEKIVEKVVEAPATEAGLYTKQEVDALLTEQRADIYEECFKMLCNRR